LYNQMWLPHQRSFLAVSRNSWCIIKP